MKTFFRNPDGPYGVEIYADEEEVREVNEVPHDFDVVGIYGQPVTENDFTAEELAALNTDEHQTNTIAWFPRAVEKFWSVF